MAELVDARVRKRFGKRWFLGTVREVWRGGAEDGHAMLAHIAYDDGDAEDLFVEDARALLVLKPEAPDAAAQAAQPAPAPKQKGAMLLTDAFQKLPAKRPAGEGGPSKSAGAAGPAARGARAKRAKVSPEEAVPELTPEEQAAAEAARKAAAAAAAEAAAAAAAAAAEARLVAQERSFAAVVPGSVHVANLCVQFDTGKSAWSGSVPELLTKLGPTPALHTLLRKVTVDTTGCCTAQEQAEKAVQLRRELRDLSSLHPHFLPIAQQLKEHMLENSKSFKAAFDAAASADDAEDAGRVCTAADFSPGNLVCYVGVDDPTAENPSFGVLNPSPGCRRMGVVVSVNDVVLVSGPVNKDGKPLVGYEASQYSSLYRPAQLAPERERRKRLVGALLSSWDALDIRQYSNKLVKTGTTRKHAYAEVLRNKMQVMGRDGQMQEELSDDPSLEQNLAVRLYDHAWHIVSYKNAPEHATGVVVTNLRADPSLSSRLLADLQIWLLPGDLTCSNEGHHFLAVRDGALPSYGNWLMRFGKHLVEPLRALESAERKAPPSTGAALLALAEKNPFAHSVAAPAALNVALKPYQRCSLAWMLAEEAGEGMLRHLWHPVTLPCATAQGTRQRRLFYSPLLSSFREQQPERVCGGWLAEAMGLGKTIVTLSLILSDHDSTVTSPEPLSADAKARIAVADAAFARRVAAAKLVKTNATLVVAPLSLIAQWESEIKLKCGALPSGKPLRVARWYGDARIRDPVRLASEFDIVLTTYETLAWSHNFREGSERYKKYVADTKARQAFASAKAVANGQDPPKEKALQTSQRATLEEIAWRRIVCDESQAMKDALVARSEACASLLSQRRWLLSGTPVSTQASDLAGQLMALQLDDLQQPKTLFNSLFDTPFRAGPSLARNCTAKGVHVYARAGAMRLLVPLLMMRHTKDMTVGGEKVLTLPPKTESTVVITLSPTERAAYNAVELEMRTRWRELCQLGIDGVSKHMLLAMSLLQPLQRMCSGGAISPSRDLASKTTAKRPWEKQMRAPPLLGAQGAARLENDPAGESCCACSLEPEDGVRTKCCGVWACHECLSTAAEQEAPKCPGCAATLRRADVPRSSKATGEGFWGDSMPAPAPAPAPDAAAGAAENDEITIDSKFKALLAELAAVRAADATAKTLIFSQFAHSLAWLGKSLAAHGYTCATITGSMSLSQRAKALEAFQNAPPTTVFLLSLRSGAVGLNLTAASHIILLEPCMNPALEEQAIGRVYRLGQTRATQVKRLVAANTIEQRMRAVVESRVAGRPAEASVHSAMLAVKKPVLALEGTVPSVAGGMRSDRAVLRYDELNALFGH